MEKRVLILGLSLLLVAAGFGRVWTSSDGREIEGDLVRVEGEVAVVKIRGKDVRIPFSKLSEEDVVFLKKEAAAAKIGTGTLFGFELKAGETMEVDEFLKEPMAKALADKDFKPTKIMVKISVPEGFDPSEPQKIFWLVGGTINEDERRRGNIGMFRRGESALEKGWIVIAADTNKGNPRSSTTKVCEADAEFHYFLVSELTKAWPDFRTWKHACGGHSSGAKGTFFRLAQLMQAEVNVVGGFFSGCDKGYVRLASQEAKVRSQDWKKIKAFQSTGDKDGLVEARHIKSVSEDLKRGGVRQIKAKTFPGNHSMSDELFKEALDWFASDEEEK